jgi:uncharacterized membrane protein YedE/YeeE
MTPIAKPYSDPYFAGAGIGVVLLSAYVLVGRGLGASGAFSSVVAAGAAAVHGTGVVSQLNDWLVLELAGVALGGFLSARLAGRTLLTIERGPRITTAARMWASLAGGVLMGLGAKLARGCTSGQALTGGALLSAGSWIFILTCFAAGYLFAPLARRLWR